MSGYCSGIKIQIIGNSQNHESAPMNRETSARDLFFWKVFPGLKCEIHQ